MEFSDLRTFETVARVGAMNRAAGALNTVQSNVTARIRLLEEEIGTPLFHRHAKGVELTAAGKRLLPYAVRAAQLREAALRAARDDGAPSGSLTVGSLETTAALRLSPVLAAYAAAYPAVDLVLRTGTTEELIRDVLERQLEGALVCGPVDHPELAEEVIFHEELSLLTGRSVGSLAEALAQENLKIIVLRAGCSYRQRLEDILARRGVVGVRRLEFGTLEAILGCVGAGLGVTLLPNTLIGSVSRGHDIAVHQLPADEARVATSFIRRRDDFASSALDAFLASTRAVARPEAA